MTLFIPRRASNYLYRKLSPSCAVPLDWVEPAFQSQWRRASEKENWLVSKALGPAAAFLHREKGRESTSDYLLEGAVRLGGHFSDRNHPRISIVERATDGVMRQALVITDRLGLPPATEEQMEVLLPRNVRVAIVGTVAEGMFRTEFLQVGGRVLPLTEGNVSDALLYAGALAKQIVGGNYDPAKARQNILARPQGIWRAWGGAARDRLIASAAAATERKLPTNSL